MNTLKSTRIESIDILRGLVMVIMALDHVRDYYHLNAFTSVDPMNVDTTNPMLFFTRFITHYCAPIFLFLAGTSAFLYGQKRTKNQLSKFLITRGIWLILVEIVVNNFLWWFDPSFGFINLQVIWAIGVCMIVLGVAIYLPKKIILSIGILIVFLHNTLDIYNLKDKAVGFFDHFWYAIHQLGGMQIGENRFLSFSYPVLPWIGVIFLGYCFGYFYKKDFDITIRRKWLLYLGFGCITLFFVVRGINVYGDLNPWTSQETFEKTMYSFFNLAKYPPSLSFLLITLGPAFLFLYFIENLKNWFTNFLLVFGRVPFFYYILHIFVVHAGAILGLLITGGNWRNMILTNDVFQQGKLAGYGYSLWVVYLVWIVIIAVLYPICKRYMKYKARNKEKWWLSYL
ncbi:MAG: DUF1624 domain-containing protein [Flavobacteriaceae bacterium]